VIGILQESILLKPAKGHALRNQRLLKFLEQLNCLQNVVYDLQGRQS